MKILLFCLFLILGCSTQSQNPSIEERPRPNLTMAFARLDTFMEGVPVVDSSVSTYTINDPLKPPATLVSSDEVNEETDQSSSGRPACYIVQYHLDIRENTNSTLIINTIFYTNDTEIESHSVQKYDMLPLEEEFVIQKVNDDYKVMPKSFYSGYTMYAANLVYLKYDKYGEILIIDPYAPPLEEGKNGTHHFAVKYTDTDFSLMNFNGGHNDGLELVYNGMHDSIDEDLATWGTTPNQAANIKYGELDIPALFPPK